MEEPQAAADSSAEVQQPLDPKPQSAWARQAAAGRQVLARLQLKLRQRLQLSRAAPYETFEGSPSAAGTAAGSHKAQDAAAVDTPKIAAVRQQEGSPAGPGQGQPHAEPQRSAGHAGTRCTPAAAQLSPACMEAQEVRPHWWFSMCSGTLCLHQQASLLCRASFVRNATPL